MNPINRRQFVSTSTKAAAAASLAGAFSINALGANEKVVIGVMGVRGRGRYLTTQRFLERKDVVVKYLADPDSRLFEGICQDIEKLEHKRPECVQDFRRVLDDKDVDAVVMATPDHWHAPGTIFACQAGKDVYVEKPCHHNPWEGKKMVEAARKYDRVVQIGHQNRSAPYIYEAIEYIRSGKLGDVHLIRVMNSKPRGSIGREPDLPNPPEGVDYAMWLGPCRPRPFNENHFHKGWNWQWEYSGGDIINDGIHQIDIARWVSGKTHPTSVYSTGGIHHFDDDQQTPDTHIATWDFNGLTMIFEQSLWAPYMIKVAMPIREGDNLPQWSFIGTRIEISGTKEFMMLGRHGGGWEAFDAEGKPVGQGKTKFSRMEQAHVQNFIDCIKDRKRPNGDVEEGHRSALLSQYANISYRLGRKLHIDSETEFFKEDEEANSLTRREYRAPFGIPDQV